MNCIKTKKIQTKVTVNLSRYFICLHADDFVTQLYSVTALSEMHITDFAINR